MKLIFNSAPMEHQICFLPEQFKVLGLREEGARWNFAAFPAEVVLFQEETLRGNCLSTLYTFFFC